jgi:hypothetical protein
LEASTTNYFQQHISRRGGVLVVDDDDDDRAAATFSNVVVGDHDRKRIVSSRNTPVELQTSTPSQSHTDPFAPSLQVNLTVIIYK